MGEAVNTRTSGQGRMELLFNAGRLDERYVGKTYTKLSAVDQMAIDQAYDQALKEVKDNGTEPKQPA